MTQSFSSGSTIFGDSVDDTPYQSSANTGCPSAPYSCGSNDDVGNYMDYMDDVCMTHFTTGQQDRIQWALETYRPTMYSNFVYTGPVWHVATTGSDATGDGTEGNPFATIQTGINAATDGDTVSVAAGTYVENVFLENPDGGVRKNISVIGENKNTTIIDGNQNGSVFHIIRNGSLFLKNFTIQNGAGHESAGGGVKISGGTAVLENLIIKDNAVGADGGGVWSGGQILQ